MKLTLENVLLPLTDFALETNAVIEAGVTGIFGPSGAGKTSLLDLVAGLRHPKSARIELDGRLLTDTAAGFSEPARRRKIGYVPQDLALFPHLSVRGNLQYGYRPEKSGNTLFSFAHVCQILEIEALVDRAVTDLSGGEKQRVALARALLASPRLLLLDEPLAKLDRPLKARILPYLRRIRDEFRLPMLYVSHEPEEVAALCDEVLLIERGRFVARGRPGDVLANSTADIKG